jgi:hypothetical protein
LVGHQPQPNISGQNITGAEAPNITGAKNRA